MQQGQQLSSVVNRYLIEGILINLKISVVLIVCDYMIWILK